MLDQLLFCLKTLLMDSCLVLTYDDFRLPDHFLFDTVLTIYLAKVVYGDLSLRKLPVEHQHSLWQSQVRPRMDSARWCQEGNHCWCRSFGIRRMSILDLALPSGGNAWMILLVGKVFFCCLANLTNIFRTAIDLPTNILEGVKPLLEQSRLGGAEPQQENKLVSIIFILFHYYYL